ncbi:hypothetical protein C8J57DRAFT_1528760 [Mycena rebaudengoi]|nr:hypothetical protein C8J57DRAFT_1528760 [Mycena rebaudengoi]
MATPGTVVTPPVPRSPSPRLGTSPAGSKPTEDADGNRILKPDALLVEPPQPYSPPPNSPAPDAQGPGEEVVPAAYDPYSIPLGEYHPEVVARDVEKKNKKRKKGDQKKKRGKQSWVWGTKLRFFEARKEQWLAAVDTNQTGAFYTTMPKLYMQKYGYHVGDDEDLAQDIADPPDEAANVVVNECLEVEDAEARSKYLNTLRLRIGAWFRAQYGNLLEEDKQAFAGMFTGNLDGAPPRPQRPQLTQYYSRKFYESQDDVPAVVKVRNEVTKEVWDEETEAFQAEVKASLEREYQASLAGWKSSLADSPTKSPEEMNATLQNAAFYLQPFVDVIQERFGMCASVFLAGPIGVRGGAIGVRSVHAGKTTGSVPRNWPEFDVQGFAAAEASMVLFAREHFMEADCRVRAIEGTLESDPSSWEKEPSTTVTEKGSEGTSVRGGSGATTPSTRGTHRAGVQNGAGRDDGGGDDDDMGGNNHDMDGNDRKDVGGNDGGAGGDDQREGQPQDTAKEAVDAAEAAEVKKCVQAMWKRKDRVSWTEEHKHAHAAFGRGKSWGLQWASCVKEFYDFEKLRNFHSNPISTVGRPEVVKKWLAKGRPWDMSPELGELGARGVEGSFVEAWWGWWIGMQPKNRKVKDGVLDEASDHHWWYLLVKIGGRNRLLQLMATLLWWGDRVGDKRDPSGFADWVAAVDDVAEVLSQMGDMREEDDPTSPMQRRMPPLPSKRNRSPADEEEDTVAPKKERVGKALKTTTEAAPALRRGRSGGR